MQLWSQSYCQLDHLCNSGVSAGGAVDVRPPSSVQPVTLHPGSPLRHEGEFSICTRSGLIQFILSNLFWVLPKVNRVQPHISFSLIQLIKWHQVIFYCNFLACNCVMQAVRKQQHHQSPACLDLSCYLLLSPCLSTLVFTGERIPPQLPWKHHWLAPAEARMEFIFQGFTQA